MSRVYDNWEKLVGAVLDREELRRLALCESFSTSISTDFSSRPSFDSGVSADPAAPSSQSISVSYIIMVIQFEEIKLATQNFQPHMLLGEGRFGPVFKGWIHEDFLTAVKPGAGIAVAVKMLNKEGLRGNIFPLKQPCHPNLVKLIGYSFEPGNRALVYEFMPNGSLDNHLFTGGHSLSWETRVKVAIGAARGLSFFHDSAIMVSHDGVKSSSIFLDEEFNANLSIFELTTIPNENDYAAPEFIATGCLTTKSDVYSFGIILLEILSGVRVCDKNRPVNEQNLVLWAKPYLRNKKKLLEIVDSKLEGQYPHDGPYAICNLVSQCLSLNPKLRPRMTEVVDTLEQLSYPLPAGPQHRQNPAELSKGGIDSEMDEAGWRSNWTVLGPVSRSSGQRFDPSDPSSQNFFFFRDVMAIEYEQIEKATRNFRPDMLLGEGGFGPVYKGWIDEQNLTAVKPGSGFAVAVKTLNNEGFQGHKEWEDEINYLSQLRHPNLVKLIGYSFNQENRILVHEFMPRGSLENRLFTRRYQVLPWPTRIKVAVGAARALAFLHDMEIPVIHGNITCHNILLDGDFNAKLSDFGLARDGPTSDMTRVSIRVMGTYGYAAPEYFATGHLTTRSDVYGFGVVLLVLISGLRVIDQKRPEGQHNLMDWAKPYLSNKKKLLLMDGRLEGQYPRKEAFKVTKIALQCVSSDPILRPRMAEVVAALEQLPMV